jgi:hypothetical protein
MSGTKGFPSFSVVVAFLAIATSSFMGCSSTQQLASKWIENPIRIDGSLRDWSDSTAFIEKDGIRYAVMNDGEYLYLCMLSSKANLGRQMTFRGLTVWFDPNGGDKKTIGLRFPIGMGGMGRSDMAGRNPEDEQGQQGARPEESPRQAPNEFEYLGPGENERQRVSRLQGQGVEIHLTATPERFLYELKIPLQYSSQHPYAVETHAGAKIGIGVESNTAQRMTEGARGGEGQEGGRPGAGGGRGGGGGRMGGGMGRGGGQMPGGSQANVNISFWSHVQLAEKVR